MPAWPTDKEAVIIVEWRGEEYHADSHVRDAFINWMTVADIYSVGSDVATSSDSAVRRLSAWIGKDDGDRPDGIVLFPFAGVDYTDCMRAAAEAGVAVHVVQDASPKNIFEELCGLYGIEDRVYHSDGDTPWPQAKDAKILVFYKESDEGDVAFYDALGVAFDSVDYAGEVRGGPHKRKRAVETLLKYLDNDDGDDSSAVEALCVFPYGDVDYTAAVDKANEKGIALHFVESTLPSDIENSIRALYELGDDAG